MKINKEGLELIAMFEGWSEKPYLCSAKVPTIGFGSTYYADGKRVTLLDKPITRQQGLELLEITASSFAKSVEKRLKVEVNQNQFNALVSFAYNVGVGNFESSTLLKKVNANPNDHDIQNEFLKWCKAGGKKVDGLEKRRMREAQIYYK